MKRYRESMCRFLGKLCKEAKGRCILCAILSLIPFCATSAEEPCDEASVEVVRVKQMLPGKIISMLTNGKVPCPQDAILQQLNIADAAQAERMRGNPYATARPTRVYQY